MADKAKLVEMLRKLKGGPNKMPPPSNMPMQPMSPKGMMLDKLKDKKGGK